MLAITIFGLVEILGDVRTKIVYLLASSVARDLTATAISALKGSIP